MTPRWTGARRFATALAASTALMTATVAHAAAAPAVPVPPTASQDSIRARCDLPSRSCGTAYVYFPGGTISVDADIHGSGRSTWYLNARNGALLCSTDFLAQEPPRSWTCNIGSGDVYLYVSGPIGATESHGALRW